MSPKNWLLRIGLILGIVPLAALPGWGDPAQPDNDPHAGHHPPATQNQPAATAPRFSKQTEPARIRAGQPFRLTYRFRLPNGKAPELVPSHEHLSHLIAVSSDLAWFSHLHPDLTLPGTFQIELTFPEAGDYVLFADATPAQSDPMLERFTLRAEGTPVRVPVALLPDEEAKEVSGYTIRLTTDPPVLQTGPARFTFEITEAGEPATDLQPYLGAGGHLVIISADTQRFLHTHPEDANGIDADGHADHETPASAAASVGWEIRFHTELPGPGLYKVWGQFRSARAGIITVPFVVEVH